MLRLWVEHDTFGSLVGATSVSVRPEVLCHADQAVFFPHPMKYDTVSQPEKAWNKGRAVYLEALNWAEKTLMGIVRILFPLQRQTHHSDRTSDANQCIAMFTTSLSTVRTNLMTLPGCMGKVEDDSGV
jgi:hypothetical protein